MGFMASGKSSIGRIVANLIDYNFIDLDLYIEGQEGHSVSKIFSDHGEEHFRNLEHNYLKEIIDQHKNVVLPLGGGTPCFDRNWELLSKTTSVYLYKTNEQLFDRLISRKEKRPLVASLSEEELKQLIEDKMNVRSSFYERADYKIPVFDSKRRTAKQLVEKINADF